MLKVSKFYSKQIILKEVEGKKAGRQAGRKGGIIQYALGGMT